MDIIKCGPIGIDCEYCENHDKCFKYLTNKHSIKDLYKNILQSHNIIISNTNKRIVNKLYHIFYDKIKKQDIYTITSKYIWFVTYIHEYHEDFNDIAIMIQNQIKNSFDFEYVVCSQINPEYADKYNGNKNKIPVILYVEP